MRRFYKAVEVIPAEGGFGIALDGRAVKTPMRKALAVPLAALAEAIAGEWHVQGDSIDPASMPLTGLANAAVDRVAPDPKGFAAALAAYGDSDVLLYRAEEPPDLAQRQVAVWNPILNWAERRYGVEFQPVTGIVHRAQPIETLTALTAALHRLDDFRLVAMQPLVTISGSLVIGLALAEGALDEDAAWAASELDELYQVEHWGEDDLASKTRQHRRDAFSAALRFLKLLEAPKA